MATPRPQMQAWRKFLRAHPGLQQFGQGDDQSTFGGKTGCTHTTLQTLILAKTGHLYSQDEISTIAKYPNSGANPAMRGLRWGGKDNEVGRVIDHFNLPYELWFPKGPLTDVIWHKVMDYMELGPVMMGIKYDWWPEWKGTVYNGRKADGIPNGYAFIGGKTQLTGFSGPHAVLDTGWIRRSDGILIHSVKEPNHGSSARKEKPAFDKVRSSQVRDAVEAYNKLCNRTLAFMVPTKKFVPR